jgi:hypothetical protein
MRVSSSGVGGGDLGVVSSQDPYITSFVGPFGRTASLREVSVGGLGQLPGYMPRSVLDKPYRHDISGLPLAKMMGNVMGISALENASKNDKPNVIMVRATNVAVLVSTVLLKFKPEVRQQVLERYGGIAWTNRVLKMAGNLPNALGVSDAVRFALGMHFVVGVLDAEAKRDSEEARAYLAFAKEFKDIEAEQKGETPKDDGQVSGLLEGEPSLGSLGKPGVLDRIGNAFKKAGNAVVSAAKSAGGAISKGLDKVADVAGDIISKGLKKILGDKVGGAIAWVITKGISVITSAIKALIEITVTAISSLWDFIKNLAAGKPMEAIKALMTGVTQMLFLLFLPISEPFMGVKADKLKEIGTKVAKKNPFFPLSLILAIVGLAPPTPTSISVLILALTPAVAVLVAPPIAKALSKAVEAVESGLEKFIKIALILFQGFMALSDVLPRLKAQVDAYLKSKGGVGGALKERGNKIIQNFKDGWTRIVEAFKKFKLQDVAGSLSTLFALVPEIIGGLLGDDLAKELPAIDEAAKAVKDSTASVTEQERKLKEGSEAFLKEMGLEQRRAVVMDNATQLKAQQAGTLTAKLVYENAVKPKTPADQKVFEDAFKAQVNTYNL